MLTDRTRKIVENALGRALSATEEAGYATLAALPPEVIASAKKIRGASNSVTVSAYLQHVVPSASLEDVRELMDELSQEKQQLTEEDQAILDKMRQGRDQRMQRYAEQGRPRPLPADSPILRKWESDEFLSQVEPGTQTAKPQTADDESAYFIERLASDDARARVKALRAMSGRPLPDERILIACERLLDDRTITLLGIPYSFGEVRWVAADAVAALRGVLGRTGEVVIEDVCVPIPSGRVEQLAEEAGVATSTTAGIEGQIETLERIGAAGRLPRRRIRREPFVPDAST